MNLYVIIWLGLTGIVNVAGSVTIGVFTILMIVHSNGTAGLRINATDYFYGVAFLALVRVALAYAQVSANVPKSPFGTRYY